MDTLTVSGIREGVDGSYDCDLSEILLQGGLTVEEAETIKDFCGARGYGITNEFLEGDWTVQAAVAMVVLARQNVRLTPAQVKGAKVKSFTFDLDATTEEEGDGETPPGEGETPSENGGKSGSSTSDGQESAPAGTGLLKSVAS